MAGLRAAVTAGAVFMHWLIFQSFSTIGVLCRTACSCSYREVVLISWFLGIITLIGVQFWSYRSTLA
ncbi:hypothetical protein [Streptosporangium sp. NPDC000396]|uniref:hypothetical protein n=1 Tax=Streptosporangium sp. NPDC000396 TaxID=3366185 RepID=UPI00367E22C6